MHRHLFSVSNYRQKLYVAAQNSIKRVHTRTNGIQACELDTRENYTE